MGLLEDLLKEVLKLMPEGSEGGQVKKAQGKKVFSGKAVPTQCLQSRKQWEKLSPDW